ncbi:MAG: hypothetical protein JW934_07570 [Anaerolineae bacterium]|nr:hypothetical protein [Anaerolineae bacterium]
MDNPTGDHPGEQPTWPLPSVVIGAVPAAPSGQQQALVGMFQVTPADIERIADYVYQLVCQDLRLERERGGW